MNKNRSRLLAVTLLLLGAVLMTTTLPATGSSLESENTQAATLTLDLPAGTCGGGGNDCHRGSPALADISNDGVADIVMATNNGHIVAVRDDGSPDGAVIWNVDIAPVIGMAPGTAWISSSPAVGDIDQNDGGRPEIVVGFGFELGDATRGGVIVLEHTGAVKSGWPKMSQGLHGNGNPKSIVSSPALGDLDNDGDLEIVVGGLDKRIYAYHHNGALVAGFPPNSAHAVRFPTWPNLQGALADSIWGSPALADLTGDGYLEIVLGTDEGNFDARYGGDAGGWICPYALPAGWADGYCGGSIYAIDRHGNILPGFPRYILEAIDSTPALADVTGDGRAEIFIGTGYFYNMYSPDHPTFGYKVYGLTPTGSDLPGWAGGKSVNGTVSASPALGNIDGDPEPEVIVGDNSGRLWAWHVDGSSAGGFPMFPRTRWGDISNFDTGKSFLLADFDGDDDMEIFMSQHESITIVNGNGVQLSTINNGADGKPVYSTSGYLMNNPAIGDVDNDGELELVAQDSRLLVWDLPAGSIRAEWGQFKRDALGTAYYDAPGRLGDVSVQVSILQDDDTPFQVSSGLYLTNVGDRPLDWSISTTGLPAGVHFNFTSGTLRGGATEVLVVTMSGAGAYGSGWHALGFADLVTLNDWGDPAGAASIPVSLSVGPLTQTFLPMSQAD